MNERVDEPGKCRIDSWIDEALLQLREAHLWREPRVRQSPHVGGLIHLDGRTYVDFGSNDYLSLAADARLIDTVRRVVGQCGWGSGASPLVTGYGVWHERLERELAEFEHADAAVVFPTGFAANQGSVTALVDRDDLVLSDALNHASLVDGCRLARATTIVYRHADAEHVRHLLAEHRSSYRRALIATDGLFSMDGDLAPLQELAECAQAFEAMLLVDEAHATGVCGEQGRGVTELLGVESQVTAKVGTLSKALGGMGGFVAGSAALAQWIRHRGRTQFFSTALPEAAAAAAVTALSIVRSEPARRVRLADNIRFLRKQLSDAGLQLPANASPIIPILIGPSTRAIDYSEKLRDRGFLVPAIREPTVPAGTARLRISVCHDHTTDQLAQLADALVTLR